MTDKKLTKKQIEKLAQRIKHDQAQPLKPAEKRLKIKTSFEQAIKAIARTKPDKSSY